MGAPQLQQRIVAVGCSCSAVMGTGASKSIDMIATAVSMISDEKKQSLRLLRMN